MAAVNKNLSVHYTLTGAQEDRVKLTGASSVVEIINRDATAANVIYVRVGSVAQPPVAATVAGDDTTVIPAVAGSRRFKVPDASGALVSIIAANASPVSLQAVDNASL